ncbi:MAG: PepSY-associated TM helix domain-containing protein [Candidatus Binatia bacterium]
MNPMLTYTLLRKIHLYTGLAILIFLVMYFVTGYPMIHYDWFPKPEPEKTTRTEPLRYTGPKEPEAFANYLKETFDLRGKAIRRRQLPDGGWEFRFTRPGTFYEVLVPPSGDSARITTRSENAVETMTGFHKLHEYRGGVVYSVWTIFYDLASFSLIVFAFTGIYLWYRVTKKKLLGWIFLGISYGYAAATVLYLMYAP